MLCFFFVFEVAEARLQMHFVTVEFYVYNLLVESFSSASIALPRFGPSELCNRILKRRLDDWFVVLWFHILGPLRSTPNHRNSWTASIDLISPPRRAGVMFRPPRDPTVEAWDLPSNFFHHLEAGRGVVVRGVSQSGGGSKRDPERFVNG